MGSLTELQAFGVPSPLLLRRILEERNLTPGVVVHAGAHEGQELETYLACGFDTIVYCEPHPQTFERLELHVGFWRAWLDVFAKRFSMRAPTLVTVPRALCEYNGVTKFHQTFHEVCSSIMDVDDGRMQVVNALEVPCCRLDDLLDELNVPPQQVGFLNLDVQGAELRVLSGAPRLLAHLPLALIEINRVARYQGQATEQDVLSLLARSGLAEVGRASPYPSYPAADILVARRCPGGMD